MSNHQQQRQPEERLVDIENGMEDVRLESEEAVVNSSSSPLYSRMNPSRQSGASLSSAASDQILKRVSTTSTNSCSTLGNGIGVSARCGFEESEDELDEYDDDEVPPPALPVRRTFSAMSSVTHKYDLSGKGYLDDAEKAMRALDTENRGTLDMKKVYLVMKEMQQQQTALHEQQKSFANLKKVVIVLTIFSMVLALANLGTAFAAATLAKDTKVDALSGALLAKGSGESVSTVSTGGVIHVGELSEPENVYERRRNLRVARRTSGTPGFSSQVEELICPGPAVGEVKGDEVKELKGLIEKGVPYVTFKYQFVDPDTEKKTRSSVSLHIEASDDDGENLHIQCTRTFPCEGDECEDGVPQYRLAPERFSFQPIGEGDKKGRKYGLFNCHTSGPLDLDSGDSNNLP